MSYSARLAIGGYKRLCYLDGRIKEHFMDYSAILPVRMAMSHVMTYFPSGTFNWGIIVPVGPREGLLGPIGECKLTIRLMVMGWNKV